MERDSAVEWLTATDALLSSEVALLIAQEASPRATCTVEVGVWKGGWMRAVGDKVKSAELIGIDPYPGFEDIREQMLSNLKAANMLERFTLYDCWQSMLSQHAPRQFSVVHVDGDHSESAVEQDLRNAVAFLQDDGVLIIDDILHPEFPGVAAASYCFLRETDMAIFALTRNKAYACKSDFHGKWHTFALDLAERYELRYKTAFGHGLGSVMWQDSRVFGFPVLLIQDARNDSLLLPASWGKRTLLLTVVNPLRRFFRALT